MDKWKLTPLAVSGLLIVWTAAVYKASYYGSWHIYPALAALPIVLLLHGMLIVRAIRRGPLIVFAIVHLVFFVILWVGCLMLISKDSL
jgi:hypothetical protein